MQPHLQSGTTPMHPAPFKKWSECEAAFKAIHPPITEAVRSEFLDRICQGEHSRYIAFQFLVHRLFGDRGVKLAPFEDALLTVLSEGKLMVKLEECGSGENVEKWVSETMGGIRSKEEWKRYLAGYHHLWVLYIILRTWHVESIFTTALTAFSKNLQRIVGGKNQKMLTTVRPDNLENFVRTLARKVPEDPVLGKGFMELLSSARSLIALSVNFADEVIEKNRILDTLHTNNAELIARSEELQNQCALLRNELAETKVGVDSLTKELGREREHFERQKGVNEELRKKMVADMVGDLRRSCMSRLENIRLFADREEPNKIAIIRLAGEIEQALDGLVRK